MRGIVLSLSLCVIALASISATNHKVKSCTVTVYHVDRYVCGDVLVNITTHEQPTGCGDGYVVSINQEFTMPIPCTHLHPPAGRY